MAEKKVILELTTSEEQALAELLSWACERILADKMPHSINKHSKKIGNINAALNAVR